MTHKPKDKAKRYGEGPFLQNLCRVMGLPNPPALIRHNTNLIYDCGDQIVRLTPNAVRSAEDVKRELHWMAFVGQHTDQVVRVLGSDATLTRQIDFEEESFTATRLEKIDGQPVQKEQWNPGHFERVGKLTGMLHRLGQRYEPPPEFALVPSDQSPEASLPNELPEDEHGLLELNQEVCNYLAAMPVAKAHFGPIHYDIHPGNYLFTSADRMVLFDFENACQGHYINDIAVVLYYARLSRHSNVTDTFNQTFLEAFWKGYATEYPVPESEIPHIDWLLLNRGLIVHSYLLKIWPGPRDGDQQHYIDATLRDIQLCRDVLAL